jgi:hypothetical protein
MEDTHFVVLAAQSILGLYGALFVGSAIFAPNWFLNTLALNHRDRPHRKKSWHDPGTPWWFWLIVIVSVLAVGMLVYAASYFIVAVIPYDWGSADEDGEWYSLRYAIQSTIGVIGGITLVSRLEDNAEVLVWGPGERRARIVATEAIGSAYHVSAETREEIAEKVERKLEPGKHCRPGWETEYAKDVQSEVGHVIRGSQPLR